MVHRSRALPGRAFVWDHAPAPPRARPRSRVWRRTLLAFLAAIALMAAVTVGVIMLVKLHEKPAERRRPVAASSHAATFHATLPTSHATLPTSNPRPRPVPTTAHARTPVPKPVSTPAARRRQAVARPAPVRDPTLLAHWRLAGNADDSSGSGHPGAVTGGVSFTSSHGGCAAFGGSSGAITAGHLLDTTASFTVAAWVKLTSAATWSTAVSQDGAQASGFYLQYDVMDHRWAFARLATDADVYDPIRALGPAPRLGVWTYLAGVYDGGSHKMYLYVNGALAGTNTDPTPFASAGPLAVGRALYAGVKTDWFHGSISDVRVYSRALSAGEVSGLSRTWN
jgi:hypothetical protein